MHDWSHIAAVLIRSLPLIVERPSPARGPDGDSIVRTTPKALAVALVRDQAARILSRDCNPAEMLDTGRLATSSPLRGYVSSEVQWKSSS